MFCLDYQSKWCAKGWIQVFLMEADFIFQIYPTSAFLITNILENVIVHIVHWNSVRRCWIAINEMFIL
jgi:hypothetical protein